MCCADCQTLVLFETEIWCLPTVFYLNGKMYTGQTISDAEPDSTKTSGKIVKEFSGRPPDNDCLLPPTHPIYRLVCNSVKAKVSHTIDAFYIEKTYPIGQHIQVYTINGIMPLPDPHNNIIHIKRQLESFK